MLHAFVFWTTLAEKPASYNPFKPSDQLQRHSKSESWPDPACQGHLPEVLS